ncbi:response regulator transcription factor [Undibacterium sp. LX40W]|uniref:Response regulator transcription factor n=1 Tax=Undibacterium nitidum TaxID=2762298 RepID=A0A923HLS5_9BURK|nr:MULTISPECIES: LytTR family DNA-binding domain-containing protein [Undibacterium]MBC3881382.1 response regulator transcription factor [Undibacterium nitidum]MBC3891835.1 response regulator transcription factor [Undibacterium sp. LX40W]
MTTKILIAEDEPLMRERLLHQLEKLWPEAEIVHQAENGNDAWDSFLEFQPELVFLDIRMPGMSGVEVAKKIGTAAHIIFITAYDQYAVQAFNAGAVDYLLKPVEEDRLSLAIDRVKQKMAVPVPDLSEVLKGLGLSHLQPKTEKMKWIKASVGKQIKLIDIDEVLFFQSDTKYTRVVLADYEALIRTPLKDLLDGLDDQKFWQIHRSTVVNTKAIAAAERVDAERMQVLIKGRHEKLMVSRNFTYLFRE